MLSKKNKKSAVLDTVIDTIDTVLPKKAQKSHKKRNILIGLGSAAAAVVAAGFSAKKDDSQ